MTLLGNDVSSYQPNWSPPKDHAFVFVKATEGLGYVNPYLKKQTDLARNAGFQVGFYHFQKPGNAAAQADYMLSQISLKPGELLVCDWEGPVNSHPSVEDAALFIARLQSKRPQNKVGLYCNLSDWQTTTVKCGDFLWLAAYQANVPVVTQKISFWQRTDDPIDLNVGYFDSAAALKSWAQEKIPKPSPVIRPPKPVVVTPWPTPTKEETMYSNQYKSEYVRWRGGYIAPITKKKLEAIPTSINLTQGGLSVGVKASAMTHAGIGAFDISIRGMDRDDVVRLANELWDVGIIPAIRGFLDDSFQGRSLADITDGNEHIHALDMDCYRSMHQSARDQVDEILRGGDGLVGGGKLYGPGPEHLQKWPDSQYNPANIKQIRGVFYVVASALVGNNVDRVKVDLKKRGDSIGFQKQVRRWGRWNIVDSRGVYWAINDGGKTAYLSGNNPNKPAPKPQPPKPPAGFKTGTYHTRLKVTAAHKHPTSKAPESIRVGPNTNVQVGSFAGRADGHNWVKDAVIKDRYWNLDALVFGPASKK